MNMKGKGSNLFEEIVSSAKDFVEKQKGRWDHTRWEGFLKDIQKKGVSLTDDLSNTLGSILESLKKFYTILPESLRKGEEPPVETTEIQPSQETLQSRTGQQDTTEAVTIQEQVEEKTESAPVVEETKPEVESQASPETEKTKTVATDVEVEDTKQLAAKTQTVQDEQLLGNEKKPVDTAEEEQVAEETSKPKKKSTAKKSTRGKSKKSAEPESIQEDKESKKDD